MAERSTVFSGLMLELNKASISGGFDIMRKVCKDKEHLLAAFDFPDVAEIKTVNRTSLVDQTSAAIFPKEDQLCKGFLPVKVMADGNCLCRTGSLSVFGNENSHIEIRVRIIFEMCLNIDWYVNISSKYAQFSASFRQGDDLRESQVVEQIFKRSVIDFAKPAAWGEMWHLAAMATVLKSTIFSIYPDLPGTKRDRDFFHKKILPRVASSSKPIIVFWTNINVGASQNRWWTPNHFVLCIKIDEELNRNDKEDSKRQRHDFTLMDYLVSGKPKKVKSTRNTPTTKEDVQTPVGSPMAQLEDSTDNMDEEQNNARKESASVEDIQSPACSPTTEFEVNTDEDQNISSTRNTPTTKEDVQTPVGSPMAQLEDSTDNMDEEQNNVFEDLSEVTAEPSISITICSYDDFDELPYDVSSRFYEKIGRLAMSNEKRDLNRNFNPVLVDEESGKLKTVIRTKLENTLSSKITSLEKKIKSEIKKSKRAHLYGVIACGKYLTENGPLVKTQALSNIFTEQKSWYQGSKNAPKRKLSIEVLELLSKHLPVMQVYIHGTGYIMERKAGNVQNFIDTVSNSPKYKEEANKNLERSMEDFKDYLQFTDTELDKSLMKAILIKIFSVKSVSKLTGARNKQTLQRVRDEVPVKLKKYKLMTKDLLPVRNDMTNKQQQLLHKRLVKKMKAQKFKTRAVGAGRSKMADKFPQLGQVLELAFGKGSKIHPRLSSDTRFRNPSLALTMREAREILLTVASDKIPKIALSTCYTYTNSFRKNTLQAKRHHPNDDVNAKISFRKLPRVGMMEERVNAHYCRSFVNFYLEEAALQKNDFLVDAKDAKGIICADIDPVQNIGKSWNDNTRLDHQFDQSRTNACTPMTHLFLETVTSEAVIKSDNLTLMNVTRTGQPVTLINLSFFEPETIFRCFNELFYLLSIPALDPFFRNKITGKLKKNWIFVVDNGPSEAPSSFVVRMLLVRLLNFLNLTKAVQVSFEKLNSKDNPAERPHAAENLVLSRHGPFKTNEIFLIKNAKPGSSGHYENMELMAAEVISCIRSARFGDHQFFCFRGVKENFIFNDELELRNFLKLSEQGKNECDATYSVNNSALLTEVCGTWDLYDEFTGSYLEDYDHLSNSLIDDVRTAWLTEYSVTIFTKNLSVEVDRFVKEPLPDYIRWLHTKGELHYMSYESRNMLPYGEWDSEELFLPDRILDLLFALSVDIPDSVIEVAALLVWITTDELKNEMKKREEKLQRKIDLDENREKWKDHELFSKTVSELTEECKDLNISPVTLKNLSKTDLITKIAETKNLEIPILKTAYRGKLEDIDPDVNSLSNFSIFQLRSILRYHNINYGGTKDELVIKTFLLRHNRSYAIFESLVSKLSKLAETAVLVLIWQRRNYNDMMHIHRTRQHSTIKTQTKSLLNVPDYIKEDNLQELFDPLLDWLDNVLRTKVAEDSSKDIEEFQPTKARKANQYEQCKQTGAKLKVYWSRENIGKSDWKIGWYFAHVIKYDESFDSLDIEYVKEPGSVYTVDYSPAFLSGNLKFVSSPFYPKE